MNRYRVSYGLIAGVLALGCLSAPATHQAEGDGGCKSNKDCERGYYCERPEGECDGEGVCAERPEVCIELYDPVCGCDGKTYSNTCKAAAGGVSVDYKGECKKPEEVAAAPAGTKMQKNATGGDAPLEEDDRSL